MGIYRFFGIKVLFAKINPYNADTKRWPKVGLLLASAVDAGQH